MTREVAINKLLNFIHANLHAKKSSENFYLIDGDKICTKCRNSKRRTLYMIIAENMPVLLKCFRMSCNADAILGKDIDVNKARPITREELITLGFEDEEAIESLLNCKDFIYKKTRVKLDNNLIIHDTVTSIEQAKYFAKRTKLSLTVTNATKYHIVPDVNALIEDNDIELTDEMNSIMKSFNKHNSITFLCNDTTLSTRALDKTPKIQKSITNISDTLSAGYLVGDLTANNTTLVIAEGVFDIINAESKIVNPPDKSKFLYVAALGFAKFLHIIEHYWFQNIETMDTLVLCMDSDVKTTVNGIEMFTYNEFQLYNLLLSLDRSLGIDNFKNIHVVYNSKGKDIGDLSEKVLPKRVDVDKIKLYAKYSKKKWRG